MDKNTVQFPNGKSVTFKNTPTPQDLQEVAKKLGTTVPTAYGSAMGQYDKTPGIIPQAVSQIEKGYQETKDATKNPSVLGGMGEMGRGALNEAGGAIRGLFSPVEAALRVGSQLPIVSKIIAEVKNHVVDPSANAISNSPALQAFMTKYPNADEVAGNLISIGLVLGGGGGKTSGTATATEEGAATTAEGASETAASSDGTPPPEDTPPVKQPGIRAQLTPVKPDVKTSFQSLLNSFGGDATKAKQFFTDLFATEKNRAGNVDVESPTSKLANTDLTQAQSKINSNIEQNVKIKDSTIAKYGDTPVTGFTEDGKTTSVQDIFNNFKSIADNLQKTKVVLTSGQATTYQRFMYGLQELAQKPTLKAVNDFVDTWQNSSLGSGGSNSDSLQAVMNSTLHDMNESAKTAADSVDEGAYRKSNEVLTKNYKVKSDLETGLKDKGAYTGKYAGAANFYKKAAEGDSVAKAQLQDIEQATGIPLAQRANLAKFAETFGKKATFAKTLTDILSIPFSGFGRRAAYNDIVSLAGDPEGAGIQIINKLDKMSKGGFSSTYNNLVSQISGDAESTKILQQAGMTPKQGAAFLILGLLNSQKKK